MQFVTYSSGDEVIVVGQLEETTNEQKLIRQLFASPPEGLPDSPSFIRGQGFTGDRKPEGYDRDVVKTVDFEGLLIRISSNRRYLITSRVGDSSPRRET